MRSTIRRTVRAGRRAAVSIAALLLAATLEAAPYRPSADAVVLERLPASVVALRAARAQPVDAARDVSASDLAAALATARRYLELGRTFGDPRAYGYAQAALGPWWSSSTAGPGLRITRARIRQYRHDFTGALAELEPALAAEPFNADGWLLFASIELVRGDARAARAACLKLVPIADPLIAATCAASSAALEGRVAQGEQLLTRALAQPTSASAGERAWSWTTLGELRARSAAPAAAEAEAAFRSALALAPDDVYTRAACADLLLDQGRARDVRALLGGAGSDVDPGLADALLLRVAIAARRAGDADAPALAQVMAQRFAEARARGDATHLREQSRFALEVEGDVPRALDLALRNFAVQREAADARVLLDAAVAARDAPAECTARRWLAGDLAEAAARAAGTAVAGARP